LIQSFTGGKPMLDLVMISAALIFFAVAIGYTIACDKLK
jgi:hypothetical protein